VHFWEKSHHFMKNKQALARKIRESVGCARKRKGEGLEVAAGGDKCGNMHYWGLEVNLSGGGRTVGKGWGNCERQHCCTLHNPRSVTVIATKAAAETSTQPLLPRRFLDIQ
jgi:hypothetical protein